MRRTLTLLLVALLAGSALAEERRARPWRRRALLGAPACEAMPPLGGPTVTLNCGSQCTSTQTYTACCARMFDLFIVDPSCRDQPPARCDMMRTVGDDTLWKQCCENKAKYQIFDATCVTLH